MRTLPSPASYPFSSLRLHPLLSRLTRLPGGEFLAYTKVHQKYTAFARIAVHARWNEPQRVNSARIRTPRSNDRCPGRAAIYSHPCSPCLSVSPPSPTYLHLHPPGSSPAAATSLSFPSPSAPCPYPFARTNLCATGFPASAPGAPNERYLRECETKRHFHVALSR